LILQSISGYFSTNTDYCSGVLYADRAMLKQQLFERSEFCCLIAIAKYNSHAEISVFAENNFDSISGALFLSPIIGR